jgi:nitronate monooxygenase
VLDLFGIELPIVQAPMAGANRAAMVVACAKPVALVRSPARCYADGIRAEVELIRRGTKRPFNLNFFCHTVSPPDAVREAKWRERLAAYYTELGVELSAQPAAGGRAPFDETTCALVEELRPAVVSFHFGLPDAGLFARVKQCGAKVLASATTVTEARWLERHGCDAIIAQGYEAGGHRGLFLNADITTQPGTLALVPQIVDAVKVPVIAAGGIGDGRGIAAVFALGAAAAQIGTAYLLTPQATISELHRAALERCADDATVLTNVFTGRPARGIANRAIRELGPMSDAAPAFPGAAVALAPLRSKAEASASVDFTSLWSGQSARMCRSIDAGTLTQELAADAQSRLNALSTPRTRA